MPPSVTPALESKPTTSSDSPENETRRVNVIFSREQFETLQKIADMQKISLSDALRQAISVSELIVNANADKNTKILIKKGKNVQELKIVR
jgi:hypothetical protein